MCPPIPVPAAMNSRTGRVSRPGKAPGVSGCGRHSGFRSVAEGAEASVYLATLGADDPSGILWGHLWTAGGPGRAYGPLPW